MHFSVGLRRSQVVEEWPGQIWLGNGARWQKLAPQLLRRTRELLQHLLAEFPARGQRQYGRELRGVGVLGQLCGAQKMMPVEDRGGGAGVVIRFFQAAG